MPDLEHILKDIRAIKTALHRHDHVIRQILLPKYFGLMSAYYGGAMLFVFGLFQGFILYYGAYDHIPPCGALPPLGFLCLCYGERRCY
jgi:hypothetical protein